MCAALEGIAAILQPAGQSLGWVVAPSLELCDRVFGLIRRVVEEHLDHRIVLIQEAGRRIVLTNMSGGLGEIRGKSAESPDSLLGEGLDWLIVDEAAHFLQAKQLGMERVPVFRCEGSDLDAVAYGIVDNRTATLAT